MLINKNPTKSQYYSILKDLAKNIEQNFLINSFKKDSRRFDKYSLKFEDILLDFSKNLIDEDILKNLILLAKDLKLNDAIQKMFLGEKINKTENRAVLHVALRAKENEKYLEEGENIVPLVQNQLQKIEQFTNKIRNKEHLGYTNLGITDVVNIGIGGSDLGPVMVCEALKPYVSKIKAHFISNIDGADLIETLKDLNPKTTLFLIASKTFTTQETMTNANSAKDWFLKDAKDQKYIQKHFVALSTNEKLAVEFGIAKENIFKFWDWVGGRFSLWSSIGLSISLNLGFEHFKALLDGANSVDHHFKNTELKSNIPVILSLVSLFNSLFLKINTEAVLPYNQYLHRFSAYLQQASMESNGKSISRDGKKIDYPTGTIVWGEPGTNGQHAFYQLIHQGSETIACDFIATACGKKEIGEHQQKLMANFFAQSKALAFGKDINQVKQELKEKGLRQEEIDLLAPHKVFLGNKPSNTLLIKKLTPYALGQLIAIYEHKIFTTGILLNVFSFDQWGVELGKELANSILEQVKDENKINQEDSSSYNLLKQYHKFRK